MRTIKKLSGFDVGPFPAARQLTGRADSVRYHEDLAALRRIPKGRPRSGIYAILDAASGELLYIGESHTGRLYDTLTRHFRRWCCYVKKPGGRSRGPHGEGGKAYDRTRVLVAYTVLGDAQAQYHQALAIRRLRPRDNELETTTTAPAPRRSARRAAPTRELPV